MAPGRDHKAPDDLEGDNEDGGVSDIDPGFKLMYLANEGDVDSIKELLDFGTDVNFRDIDYRTALHVSACQGYGDVAKLLLENGADVDPKDRWGSTPLADAIHYKNHGVIKLLENHGAKRVMAPMHVRNAREVPEYEIDPRELDFTNSIEITKVFRCVLLFDTRYWQTLVWIRFHSVLFPALSLGSRKLRKLFMLTSWRAFRDELSLLQKIRHPNVVQFLGAVTQSSPMMIVTEYLPKGDLHEYLKRKGALKPETALRFAMDIASNILRDDSGNLKVADFGVSKLLKVANGVREDRPLTCQDTACEFAVLRASNMTEGRYVAPEVFRNEEYDTKVDVFSFALILQELIEGCPPFYSKQDHEVPKSYVAKERPPFRASTKLYAHGLKELIEGCWSENPSNRPTFKQIIPRLDAIYNRFAQRNIWKHTLSCHSNAKHGLCSV
ncbi:hypothetical protein DH2020_042023 [Rehmannia glutinosa]|uniref:Protein kinase domain-containing protein n=1 Tax=Rehmannia glutinosa TaxID=99300 RepID=A0ABR0UQC9_REHGL